jgi:hypothetical protein
VQQSQTARREQAAGETGEWPEPGRLVQRESALRVWDDAAIESAQQLLRDARRRLAADPLGCLLLVTRRLAPDVQLTLSVDLARITAAHARISDLVGLPHAPRGLSHQPSTRGQLHPEPTSREWVSWDELAAGDLLTGKATPSGLPSPGCQGRVLFREARRMGYMVYDTTAARSRLFRRAFDYAECTGRPAAGTLYRVERRAAYDPARLARLALRDALLVIQRMLVSSAETLGEWRSHHGLRVASDELDALIGRLPPVTRGEGDLL